MNKWFTIEHDGIPPCATFASPVPDTGGCYAIYADGKLVYVGSTENLYSRVRTHIEQTFAMLRPGSQIVISRVGTTERVPVRRWKIKVRPAQFFGDWATLELRLIRRLRPLCNFKGIKPAKKRKAA